MKVTADTITDAQIDLIGREARARLEAARVELDAALTAMTFHPLDVPADRRRRRAARALCADAWNARHGGDS